MKLCKINISAVTKKDAIQSVEDAFKIGRQEIIFTPNPEIILESHGNPRFFEALKCGTLMLPDGNGLKFVATLSQVKSKLLRAILYVPALFIFLFWKGLFSKYIPEIIHGADFMFELVKMASENGKKVFFLGGRDDVARKTSEFFKNQFMNLELAGFSELDPTEDALKIVLDAKPDLLFVAYGAPKQEEWVNRWRKKLSSVNVVMTVGGSFDFYSGNIKRAPALFRKLGIEWLWRLLKDPIGRSKRIWRAVVGFPFVALFWD